VQESDTCNDPHKRKLTRPVAMLNRIVFTDYHRLGSEMVIVPGQQNPAATDHGSRDASDPKAPALPAPSPQSPRVPPSQ
jgi:hypothetical protein